jgi:hypothetical protein
MRCQVLTVAQLRIKFLCNMTLCHWVKHQDTVSHAWRFEPSASEWADTVLHFTDGRHPFHTFTFSCKWGPLHTHTHTCMCARTHARACAWRKFNSQNFYEVNSKIKFWYRGVNRQYNITFQVYWLDVVVTFYQLCSSIILNDGMIVNDELGIWTEAASLRVCPNTSLERLREATINHSQD